MRVYLLLIFLAVLFGCTKKESQKIALEEQFNGPFYGRLVYQDQLVDPSPQAYSKRVFEDVATDIVQQFTTRDSMAHLSPGIVIMNKPFQSLVDPAEEFLYIMGPDSNVVHKFSIADGRLVNRVTTPRDLRESSGYTVGMQMAGNDEFWFQNVKPRTLMRTTHEGKLIDTIKLPYAGWVSVTNSGDFVFLETSNLDELFHVYSANGKHQHSFGILSSVLVQFGEHTSLGHGLGFVGDLSTDGSDSFIYTNGWGGGLLNYSLDGTLNYFRQPIDSNPFPGLRPFTAEEKEKSNIQNSANITVDKKDVNSQKKSVNVWEGTYYQTTFERNTDRSWFVDAYDYDTGDYLYSIPTPEDCFIEFITDKHLYANCLEPGFVQFKRPPRVIDPVDEPALIQAAIKY